MRRFFNGLGVFALVLFLSVPASAAPRHDDGPGDYLPAPIKKIVQLLKKIVKPLEGGDMSIPKP